jgi:predicted ATPase
VHESVTLDGSKLFLFEKGLVQLFRSKTEAKAQFPLHPYRSGLAMVESRPDDESLGWFKAWLDQLLYVQIDPRRMGSLAEREVAFPAFDLENFASWYRHLRLEDGTAMEALRRSLTEVISGFESLDLKEAGLNRRVLQVSTRVDGKAFQYSFEELSDGQRALVGLYTLLHRSTKQESLLCIDEPDNFVALAEIQPWLMLLEDAQELGLQVLVASHHPELLNQLANKDGVVLGRPDFRHSQVRAFSALSDLPVTPAELIARGWEGV